MAENDPEFRARQLLDVMRGTAPRQPIKIEHRGSGSLAPHEPATLDLLALAQFDPTNVEHWFQIDHGVHKGQLQAWRKRLEKWGAGGDLWARKEETGEFTEYLDRRYPKLRVISRVPCEWPPRKDGTLSTAGPPDPED